MVLGLALERVGAVFAKTNALQTEVSGLRVHAEQEIAVITGMLNDESRPDALWGRLVAKAIDRVTLEVLQLSDWVQICDRFSQLELKLLAELPFEGWQRIEIRRRICESKIRFTFPMSRAEAPPPREADVIWSNLVNQGFGDVGTEISQRWFYVDYLTRCSDDKKKIKVELQSLIEDFVALDPVIDNNLILAYRSPIDRLQNRYDERFPGGT